MNKTKQKESWEIANMTIEELQFFIIELLKENNKLEKQLTKAKREGAEEAVRGFVEFCFSDEDGINMVNSDLEFYKYTKRYADSYLKELNKRNKLKEL